MTRNFVSLDTFKQIGGQVSINVDGRNADEITSALSSIKPHFNTRFDNGKAMGGLVEELAKVTDVLAGKGPKKEIAYNDTKLAQNIAPDNGLVKS